MAAVENPPYGAYAAIVGVFVGGLGAAGLPARVFDRDPFVKGDAHGSDEDPVQSGDYRQAIGELVTCSRCGGTWVAAALASSQILAPRFGRLLTWSLAAAGINDWLQAGFAALTKTANES
jgi:hypothetical protein